MFAIGPVEALVVLLVLGSGVLAAVYLALALRRHAARDDRQP